MKDFETNIPSTASEVQPFDSPEELSEKRFSLLRKIGNKVLTVMPSTAALYGISHTLDPSLPPQYAIPASMVGGFVVDTGTDALKKLKEKRKNKDTSPENPPEDPEITSTDASVV